MPRIWTSDRSIVRAAALTALIALAGCAGVDRVFNVSPIPQHRADMSRAATGGTQFVEIHGAPPDGAAPQQVAEALSAPAGFRATRYALAQPGQDGLRLVLEFGGQAGGQTSCRTPRGTDLAADAPMQVAATLCLGSGDVSNATLVAPDVTGPSSPDFERATHTLLREVLTPERPRRLVTFLR